MSCPATSKGIVSRCTGVGSSYPSAVTAVTSVSERFRLAKPVVELTRDFAIPPIVCEPPKAFHNSRTSLARLSFVLFLSRLLYWLASPRCLDTVVWQNFVQAEYLTLAPLLRWL